MLVSMGRAGAKSLGQPRIFSVLLLTASPLDPPPRPRSASAWDTVEELNAAASHAKAAKVDPLEQYCEGNPDADECRVYGEP